MSVNNTLYEKKLHDIIHGLPYRRQGERPTKLLDHLYIGNYKDAADVQRLKEVGITHVVNCAPLKHHMTCPYDANSGIVRYQVLQAEDKQDYDILRHLPDARDVIDDAKRCHSKALVHCAMGINRCAAICAAYIMLDQGTDLMETVRNMKERRAILLFNTGFQQRLVEFARENGHLPPLGDDDGKPRS